MYGMRGTVVYRIKYVLSICNLFIPPLLYQTSKKKEKNICFKMYHVDVSVLVH